MEISDSDEMVTGYDETNDRIDRQQRGTSGGHNDEKGLSLSGMNNGRQDKSNELQDEKQLNFTQNSKQFQKDKNPITSNLNKKTEKQEALTQPTTQYRKQIINDKNFITFPVNLQRKIQLLGDHTKITKDGKQQQDRQEQQKQQKIQSEFRKMIWVGDDGNNDDDGRKGSIKLERQMLQIENKGHQKQSKNNVIDQQSKTQQQQRIQSPPPIDKVNTYSTQLQRITQFHSQYKSPTITYNQSLDQAQQSKYYFQNCKLALTQPIKSINSTITFRIDNLKYCVGVGVGLKQVLSKHNYDYLSTTNNQLGHGLYILTTQGYSWSHSQTQDDDIFRGQQWKNLYTGANLILNLQGQILTFKFKKSTFTLTLPSRIREKYTLCFCAYLHEKTDAVSIVT